MGRYYLVEHSASLPQTGKTFLKQGYLLVCCGPKDMSQELQRAFIFALPEVGTGYRYVW
jgi:hypothetical protein